MTITLHFSAASDSDFLRQAQQAIAQQLTNVDLDVSALCHALGMSRSTLHCRLKESVGMSTTEYVRHVRLTVACQLLTQTSLNVSEVAYQTGFQSHNYFSRCFRDVYGMAPKAWRSHHMS